MAYFDIIIWNKEYFKLVAYCRIIVHHLGHRGNQFDNAFGHEVTWCCFAAKDEKTGGYFKVRVGLKSGIKRDDMEDVEMLSFIFVDSFDLNIKEGSVVNFDIIMTFNEMRKIFFIFFLNPSPGF